MPERRRSPRIKCRLQCTIRRGRERIRARVLDVSEGGLCLLAPAAFDREETLVVDIDVPRKGPVEVEAKAWHVRSAKKGSTTRRNAWIVGAMLVKAGDGYQALLPDSCGSADPGDQVDPIDHAVDDAVDDPVADDDATIELRVFRVRIKANDSPRTRTLSLAAATGDEARSLAAADLGDSWAILDVEPR